MKDFSQYGITLESIHITDNNQTVKVIMCYLFFYIFFCKVTHSIKILEGHNYYNIFLTETPAALFEITEGLRATQMGDLVTASRAIDRNSDPWDPNACLTGVEGKMIHVGMK